VLLLLERTEGNPPSQGLHDCATLKNRFKCLALGLQLVDSQMKRNHVICLSMLPIAGGTEEIAAKETNAVYQDIFALDYTTSATGLHSLLPGSFVIRFSEAGLRRIAVRFGSAKPAAPFVIRRSVRDFGLAESRALLGSALQAGSRSVNAAAIFFDFITSIMS
jgi:hypothetical protein